MKFIRPFIVAIVCIFVGLAIYIVLQRQEAVPNIALSLIDGKQLQLPHDLKGQVVLVNFWATSCSTCIKEMPHLVDLSKRYHTQGLRVVGVAMSYDTPMYVQNYAKAQQLPFAIAFDVGGRVAQSFGRVQLTPTSFLIDKQGHIVKRYLGEPDYVALNQLIENLLQEKS